MLINKETSCSTAESYRKLRTNIKYLFKDKSLKKVLVTSTEKGEGKSTIASNLACIFAKDSKKILIIDCDLRSPSIHEIFEVSNEIGFSDVIIDITKLEESIINYCEYLDILPSGKIPKSPSEFLGSNNMDILLEKLSESYDLIIIDSPPLLSVTDAQIISTKVDGTALVIKANKVSRENVLISKYILEKLNSKILGAVLNFSYKK
ncbi:TPA: CpsD/CapB family tyrosine-protein kinase [Clostridium perfringens]|nr:CpsD/CapB family tyrosine-protein kinase [Clostridium perfringens]